MNNIEHHGRLLMSVDSFDISQTSKLSMVISLIAFLFRTIAIMFIFFKLFVFGEPSWRPDSNSAANFRFYKKQGNLAILKVCALLSLKAASFNVKCNVYFLINRASMLKEVKSWFDVLRYLDDLCQHLDLI